MRALIILILISFMQNPLVLANDLGKLGNTFRIEEEAFTLMMKRKLAEIDMEAAREKMQKIAIDRVENPAPVIGITVVTENRTFYFDPTYTLDEDAVLPCGKILHKAGTTVNPLEHMDLNRRLFFVDSREASQVEWLQEQLNNPLPEQKEPVEDRIILVGGSVFKLHEILGQKHEDKVYFDQNGELTTRFGIKHSPAIAAQEELKIRIDEINLAQANDKKTN
jgi:conjugal transfer pilus assembly protein TraW